MITTPLLAEVAREAAAIRTKTAVHAAAELLQEIEDAQAENPERNPEIAASALRIVELLGQSSELLGLCHDIKLGEVTIETVENETPPAASVPEPRQAEENQLGDLEDPETGAVDEDEPSATEIAEALTVR